MANHGATGPGTLATPTGGRPTQGAPGMKLPGRFPAPTAGHRALPRLMTDQPFHAARLHGRICCTARYVETVDGGVRRNLSQGATVPVKTRDAEKQMSPWDSYAATLRSVGRSARYTRCDAPEQGARRTSVGEDAAPCPGDLPFRPTSGWWLVTHLWSGLSRQNRLIHGPLPALAVGDDPEANRWAVVSPHRSRADCHPGGWQQPWLRGTRYRTFDALYADDFWVTEETRVAGGAAGAIEPTFHPLLTGDDGA